MVCLHYILAAHDYDRFLDFIVGSYDLIYDLFVDEASAALAEIRCHLGLEERVLVFGLDVPDEL